MRAARRGDSRRIAFGVIFVALVFFGARIIPLASVFDARSPLGVSFIANDEWVHFHRAEQFALFGSVPNPDRSFNYPQGLSIHWPTGYAIYLGYILRWFGVKALALSPIIPGALIVSAAWLGAGSLGISRWGAAAVCALMPLGVNLTGPGAIDHLGWEPPLLWLAIILFAQRPYFSGFLIGALFHISPSASMAAGIYLLSIASQGALARRRGRYLGEEIENAVFMATLVALPAGIEIISFDAPSLFQVFGLAGVGFMIAAFFSDAASRMSRFMIGSSMLVAILLPGLSEIVRGGQFLSRSDPWLERVSEWRPMFDSPVSPFQYIQRASVGLIALPFFGRRIPATYFAPALGVLICAFFQIHFLHMALVPAAWAFVMLNEKIIRDWKIKATAARILVALVLFSPCYRPLLALKDLAPGIPDSTYQVLLRAIPNLDSQDAVLARWDLAGHIVGMTRASSIGDGFHRNVEGRKVWSEVLLSREPDARALLSERRITAIIITDPFDGYLTDEEAMNGRKIPWNETFFHLLWTNNVSGWRMADEVGTTRIYRRI